MDIQKYNEIKENILNNKEINQEEYNALYDYKHTLSTMQNHLCLAGDIKKSKQYFKQELEVAALLDKAFFTNDALIDLKNKKINFEAENLNDYEER